MHACGHDAHVAILMGVAEFLYKNTYKLKNVSNMFCNCYKLNFNNNLNLNLDNCVNIDKLFNNCHSLVGNVILLNTSLVKTAKKTFYKCAHLSNIFIDNTTNIENMEQFFYGCENLNQEITLDLTKCIYLSGLFGKCKKMKYVILYNTENVKVMNYLFYKCHNLIQVYIESTINVEDMAYLFYECNHLLMDILLDVPKCKTIQNMFSRCGSILNVKLTNCSLIQNMKESFDCCVNLEDIDFDTLSNVVNLNACFRNCYKLNNINLDIALCKDLGSFVDGCQNLETITLINTSAIQNCNLAFRNCIKLKNISLNLQNCVETKYMFYNCNQLETVNLQLPIVKKIDYMFYNCKKMNNSNIANYLNEHTISGKHFIYNIGFNPSQYSSFLQQLSLRTQVTNIELGDTNLKYIKNVETINAKNNLKHRKINIVDCPVTLYGTFKLFIGEDNLKTDKIIDTNLFNNGFLENNYNSFINISFIERDKTNYEFNWTYDKITDDGFFIDLDTLHCYFKNLNKIVINDFGNIPFANKEGQLKNYPGLISVNSSPPNLSRSLTLKNCFYNSTAIQSIGSAWDFSYIKSMENMFMNCKNFNGNNLIFNMNNCMNTKNMFHNCSSLDNVSFLNTGHITNTSFMFKNCSSLRSINGFDFVRTLDSQSMFENCSNLISVSILKNLFNCVNMSSMFKNCRKLQENLINLDLNSCTNTENMFLNCELLQSLKFSIVRPVKIKNMKNMFNGCKLLNLSSRSDPSRNVMDYISTFTTNVEGIIDNGNYPIKDYDFILNKLYLKNVTDLNFGTCPYFRTNDTVFNELKKKNIIINDFGNISSPKIPLDSSNFFTFQFINTNRSLNNRILNNRNLNFKHKRQIRNIPDTLIISETTIQTAKNKYTDANDYNIFLIDNILKNILDQQNIIVNYTYFNFINFPFINSDIVFINKYTVSDINGSLDEDIKSFVNKQITDISNIDYKFKINININEISQSFSSILFFYIPTRELHLYVLKIGNKNIRLIFNNKKWYFCLNNESSGELEQFNYIYYNNYNYYIDGDDLSLVIYKKNKDFDLPSTQQSIENQFEPCFTEDSFVLTHEGYIPINSIVPGYHKIGKKIIKNIIKSVMLKDSYIIKMNKSSLKKNSPFMDTYITCKHKIYDKYSDMFKEAKYFLNNKNIELLKLDKTIFVYNVLLEDYTYMYVNNIIAETMNPTTKITSSLKYSPQPLRQINKNLKQLILKIQKNFLPKPEEIMSFTSHTQLLIDDMTYKSITDLNNPIINNKPSSILKLNTKERHYKLIKISKNALGPKKPIIDTYVTFNTLIYNKKFNTYVKSIDLIHKNENITMIDCNKDVLLYHILTPDYSDIFINNIMIKSFNPTNLHLYNLLRIYQ